MTAQEINKTESNFKYPELSVQVSLNGLSFLIKNASQEISFNKYLSFNQDASPEYVLFEIKKCYEQYPLLNQPISDLKIIHRNMLNTFVPQSLFDVNQLNTYLKLNTRVFETDYFSYDEIEALKMVNVYVPLVNINNYFYDRYGEFTFHHASSIWIEKTIKQANLDINPSMHVYIHENQMDVVVLENKNLLLFNSFAVTTPEDIIYYILFVAEQLTLNPEQFKLYLSGNINENDEIFKWCFTYVRHVFINKTTHPFSEKNTQNNFLFDL